MRIRLPSPHHRLGAETPPGRSAWRPRHWHTKQHTESSEVMTDQHNNTPTTQPARSVDTVTQACVHIDTAARQLEASARGDVFSTLLGLAGQLALIRGGIDPTIRAAPEPSDRLGPVAHVDKALALLGSVPAGAGPADLLVWTMRLADLREGVLAAGAGQP